MAQVEVDKAYTVRSDAETQVRNATAKAYEEKGTNYHHFTQNGTKSSLTV